jgi:CRISPR-associated protein Cas1
MPNLYICEQGVKVNLEGEQLVLSIQGIVLDKVGIALIERVLVFGNVQFTSQSLSLLAHKNIPVSFHSTRGKFRFSINLPMGKNGARRLRQYMLYNDTPWRLSFSKNIAEAKIKNSVELINRYSRRKGYPRDSEFNSGMLSLIEKIRNAHRNDAVMGFEGSGAKKYFNMYGLIINRYIEFKGRSKRPPLDPANALLSLGYTLIANEISSFVEGCGCDPSIGFFHEIQYSRASLALDICEEFRALCIDRFILYLAGEKIFIEQDFEYGNGACYLRRDSLKRFYGEYEKWMTRDMSFKNPLTWRELIKKEAEKLALSIDTGNLYIPFVYGEDDADCGEL